MTYYDEACKALSVRPKTRRRLVARHKPPVKLAKKSGKSKDGRGLRRTYVPTWFVEETKRERFPKLIEDESAVAEAAEILGCSIAHVHALIDAGHLVTAPRRLGKSYQQSRESRTTQQWGLRPALVLSRRQVLEAKTQGVWPRRLPKRDRARWRTAKQIADQRGVSGWEGRLRVNHVRKSARQRCPDIAVLTWYVDSSSSKRWHRAWLYDTQRLGFAGNLGPSTDTSSAIPLLESWSAEQTTHPPSTEGGTRRRGRPTGSTDPRAANRKEDVRRDWREGCFASIAERARRHHVSRSRASEIIHGRE